MRLIKMIGLAALIALAAMAFVGASSVSADSLCLVDPVIGGHNGECPAEKVYKGPILGLAKSSVILAEGLETLCKSEFLADWIKNEGAHIGLELLILHFIISECKGSCKSTKAENLPYKVLAVALKLHVIVTGDGKGNPAWLKECTLFGFPVNCLYEAKEALLEYELGEPGKTNAALKALVPLTRGGDSALCPASGEWHALYEIYKDLGELSSLPPIGKEGAPLYLTALP
jgi:hypothetical protein